jgi:hypothetical protein
MQAPSSEAGWKRSESLHWKSSSAPIRPTVSKPCHADGWSSEHLHGWEGVADWPKTSRKLSLLPKRGYTSQISASSHGVSQEPDIITFIMIQALTDDGIDELRQMLADARRSAEKWQEFLECFVDDEEIVARVKTYSPR